MNLEQFKESLDSDARRRCVAQEKTIKEYREKIAEKDEIIRVLSNRCFAFTTGSTCHMCGIKDSCHNLAETRRSREMQKAQHEA